MPELPEVDHAARILRAVIVGRTIADIALLHASLQRRIRPARLRALRGAVVQRVERRGKHQLIALEDGRVIHVHFRMTGDWTFDSAADALPRFARAFLTFTDGSRVVLDDPRALSTLDVYAANTEPKLRLGPEPTDKTLTPESFASALSKRRGPIKTVLLDQRIIAGLGNIYAAESLWRAGINPRARASRLSRSRVANLLTAIRRVMSLARGARYGEAAGSRFGVYDREGKPCRLCRSRIARIVQAGRSTYYCPTCQAR